MGRKTVGATLPGGVQRVQNQSGFRAEAVVVGTDFSFGACNKIWVGSTGNMTVLLTDGTTTVTYTAIPAGMYIDVAAIRVTAASAGNMVAQA